MEDDIKFDSFEFVWNKEKLQKDKSKKEKLEKEEKITITLNKSKSLLELYLFSLFDKNTFSLLGFCFIAICSLHLNIPGWFALIIVLFFMALLSVSVSGVRLNEELALSDEDMQQVYQQIAWDKLLSETRVDKTFWFNHTIKTLWKYIQKHIQAKLIGFQTGFVRIEDVNIGNEPIWVNNVYSSGSTRENFLDMFIFDVDLEYHSSKAQVIFSLFTKYITAGIANISVRANAKIVVKYIKWFADEEYTVKEVVISFLEAPRIFDCESRGLLRLYSILGTFEDLVSQVIRRSIVYPYTITIKLPDTVKHAARECVLKLPFGLITVEILEADNLPSAISGPCTCRKPNPYCNVNIQMEKFQSHTIISEDSPWFNFKCSTYANVDFNCQIGVEICDNTFGRKLTNAHGELIGQVFLDVNEHTKPSKNGQSSWISLTHTERSQLHYRISCFELSTRLPDIKDSLKLARFGFPTGVMTVFVDSASGLTNFSRQKEAILGAFHPYASVRLGNMTFETPLSDQSHTPIWEQVFYFPMFNPHLQELFVQVIAKQSGGYRAIGSATVPLDKLLGSLKDRPVDKEYQLKGIVKNAFIRLAITYQGAKLPPTFEVNYERNTKVAEQLGKESNVKKEKELKVSVDDNLSQEDFITVKLKISWPKGSEIHVDVIEIRGLQLKVRLRYVYVVLHLRYKQYVLQVKKTAVAEAKRNISVNQTIVFKGIDKNIRVYHLRVSVHTTRTSKYVFNKIADAYIKFPQLSPGPDFDESYHRLLITLPFKLMSKNATDEGDYLIEDEDRPDVPVNSTELPLTPKPSSPAVTPPPSPAITPPPSPTPTAPVVNE
ncbi:Extended synaptotagmin-2-B-like protein [Leptotrombidium deliense]|uniref:Extended synaptotagmin-2-B-like protein n=1 Tax=Leptotrombidium deliense TaxID=299467 RepID=A0A443SQL1_9ACAR|nr:Extended synaptotagmin-2-B-like protein [Leptotrombidium deliense]